MRGVTAVCGGTVRLRTRQHSVIGKILNQGKIVNFSEKLTIVKARRMFT